MKNIPDTKLGRMYRQHIQYILERVAEEVGFGSASVLREHFVKAVKVSPSEWRRSFASRT